MHLPTGSSHDYDEDEELPPLTPYLVDKALDEVRPYLIADGGNVEVAAVQDGVVMLRLQGACGTCPSSTATMKMGIERSLRVGALCVPCVQLPVFAGVARPEFDASYIILLLPSPAGKAAVANACLWRNPVVDLLVTTLKADCGASMNGA